MFEDRSTIVNGRKIEHLPSLIFIMMNRACFGLKRGNNFSIDNISSKLGIIHSEEGWTQEEIE